MSILRSIEHTDIPNGKATETAYEVKSKKGLDRLNCIFGLSENCYPALYVNMAGFIHPVPLDRKSQYISIGYRIVNI